MILNKEQIERVSQISGLPYKEEYSKQNKTHVWGFADDLGKVYLFLKNDKEWIARSTHTFNKYRTVPKDQREQLEKILKEAQQCNIK